MAALFRDYTHEIILIDDAKSLCEGYMRGFRRSKGQLVIFSHDDIEFVTPDLGVRLTRHLSQFDIVGVAGTTRVIDGKWTTAGDPYCFALFVNPVGDDLYSMLYAGAGALCVPRIQALDGCFFACRREVIDAVGFDAELFDGFHLYDVDFTFRAHLMGFRLAVCRDLALIHASLGHYGDTWQRYNERFIAKFLGKLAPEAPGKLNVISARLNKRMVAQLCRPEILVRATRRAL